MEEAYLLASNLWQLVHKIIYFSCPQDIRLLALFDVISLRHFEYCADTVELNRQGWILLHYPKTHMGTTIGTI